MDSLFKEYADNAHDVDQISAKLAVILDNLNNMPLYREGTVYSDVKILEQLISSLLEKIEE